MKKNELLKKAESLYVSYEKIVDFGNHAQPYFRTDLETFGVFEHVGSGSYVPIGGNDGYISIPVRSIFENLYGKYCKVPSKDQMAEAIVKYLLKKGVKVDDN